LELAISKFKIYKPAGSIRIPAELIQAEVETLGYKIHKLNNSTWNKEESPDQWKESIIVPIHKKGDKTDCNNYRGISLLSTSYNILSNILLSRLVNHYSLSHANPLHTSPSYLSKIRLNIIHPPTSWSS
jgi:hypothetical protein